MQKGKEDVTLLGLTHDYRENQMQIIREFHIPQGDTITLKIPPKFLGQQIEVILLPIAKTIQTAAEALEPFLASEDSGALDEADIDSFSQGRKKNQLA